MRFTRWIAALMAWVMFTVPCLQTQVMAARSGDTGARAPIYFGAALEGRDPGGVYTTLWAKQQAGQLSFEETMDMAMALFLQQQWDQAAGVYKSAAANTTLPTKKAAAMAGAAQSLAAAHKWAEAGRLMNEINRLIPNSKEAAAMRFAYWTNAGDALETRVAQDRMKQLNLNSEGKVVCDPGTILVILIIAVIAAETVPVVAYVIKNNLSSDEMKAVAEALHRNLMAILSCGLTKVPG